jgi:hypothetical protein
MTKSPFQLIVMVFFALAALVAVGVLSGVITLPKSAKESVQGSVVAWGTLDEKTFRFSTNFLKTLNKNVSFQYVQQPVENFESLLNEAIASGRGPDIIIISQEQILRNKSKIAAQKISSSDSIDYKEKYNFVCNKFQKINSGEVSIILSLDENSEIQKYLIN